LTCRAQDFERKRAEKRLLKNGRRGQTAPTKVRAEG
jgi:hypothetical protein